MSTANAVADLDAAIQHIQANPLSDSEIISALVKIQDQVSQPDAGSQLIKEIENLCDSAATIESAFSHVSSLLHEVRVAAPQELHEPLDKLAYKWQEYRNTYLSVLWESRSVAAEARAGVDDLLSGLLPLLLDDTVSLEGKKQEVEQYCKYLEVRELKAKDVSEKYRRLQEGVVEFDEEWKATAYKIQGQQSSALQGIESEINNLTNELSELEAKMKPLLAVVGLGPLGVLTFPFGIAPLAASIAAAAALVKLKAQAAELTNRLNQKKAQREQIAQQHGEITVRLGANVGIAKQDFAEIVTKLNAFSSVWAAIRTDLLYVSGVLEHSTFSKLYKARLHALQSLYVALGQALQKYAESIGGVLEGKN